MAKAKADPLHPLAMAAALEHLNDRIGGVVMAVQTAQSLAADANADQLRTLLAVIVKEADALRLAAWPENT
jgi:hypothetical protein